MAGKFRLRAAGGFLAILQLPNIALMEWVDCNSSLGEFFHNPYFGVNERELTLMEG
jgi:hypothetical protein